jgi:hypothetical protein
MFPLQITGTGTKETSSRTLDNQSRKVAGRNTQKKKKKKKKATVLSVKLPTDEVACFFDA